MDHAEVIVSPTLGEEKIVQSDFHEPNDTWGAASHSIPSTIKPKVIDTPAQIKINVRAGLYDLFW